MSARTRAQILSLTLLSLGQAESGKSTILKNFQLVFAPKSFHAEAVAWTAVIHLNLVRSVNFVLDLLEEPAPRRGSSRGSSMGYPRSPPSTPSQEFSKTPNDIRYIKLRLTPLRSVQRILTRRFVSMDPTINNSDKPQYHHDRASEVRVRGGSGWKALLNGRKNQPVSDDLEDSRRVIEACKDDMIALWENSVVQQGLKKRNVQLQDQAGLYVYVFLHFLPEYPHPLSSFLADVSRIAAKEYIPTSGKFIVRFK